MNTSIFKKNFPKIKKTLIFSSPFLISLYPLLFLYANNIGEFPENVLFLPLLMSLGLAIIVLGVCRVIFKKIEIAAPIASALLFICLSYSRFYEQAQNFIPSFDNLHISSKLIYLFIILLLLSVFTFFVLRYRKHLLLINKTLSVGAFILVFIALLQITVFELQEGRLWRGDIYLTRKNIPKSIQIPKNSPDIYYFIFDKYAGQRALSEQYKFDNSSFLNFLKEKGFYVPDNSTTNYPKTFLSLSSSLNLEYVNFLTAQTKSGKSSDESITTPLIQDNKVVQFLRQRGYSYIHMGSWWQPTAENPNADKNFIVYKGSYWGTDEFTTGFINTTAFASILNRIRKNPINVSMNPANNDHRRRLYYEFDTATNQIPQIPGPKFVFAHILAPHDPFVVDENCTPITEKTVSERTSQVNYLNQLKCTNIKIKELVNSILLKSKTPPVIIFQADEGPFPMNSPLPDNQSWSAASEQTLREKFPIFNAYYFPGVTDTHLYNSITPVNSFRILFNDYFGTNYPLLPDKNYIFQDGSDYYKFIDVTSKVKN